MTSIAQKDLLDLVRQNKLDGMLETLTYLFENEIITEDFLAELNLTCKTLILQESEYLNLVNIKKTKRKTAPMFLDLQIFKKI